MVGSRVLEDLRVEHRAMGKLLELLEHQLDLVAQDRRPDDELLLQIAEYFASVPDIYHHPKEDVVLRRLAARNPGFAEIAGLLEAEHEAGDREVQRFLHAVVRLVLEPELGAERFLDAGRAMVDNERRHMAWEEKSFFQLAERVLAAEDWSDIESRLSHFIDPLERRVGHQRFSRLDRALANWRGPRWSGSSASWHWRTSS
jgi:hemerythrin-like domain-containing protein